MSWKGKSVLAVVPARGGSKGIPRKNLRTVGGVSLVGWAARTAAALPWLDAAVLSTDDEEIASEGRRVGLDVPFLRPAELASDSAGSAGMWRHAWLESERHFGRRFDLSVLLQPTTPLRRPEDVERTVAALVEGGHRAAMTVSPLSAHYAPQKCLTLGPDGRVAPAFGRDVPSVARQALPSYYWRNGNCYAVRRDTLVDDLHIVEDDCVAVVLDEFQINIDEPVELELAEFVLARRAAAPPSGRPHHHA